MGAHRVHTILITDFKAVDAFHQSVETTIKAVDIVFACLQVISSYTRFASETPFHFFQTCCKSFPSSFKFP